MNTNTRLIFMSVGISLLLLAACTLPAQPELPTPQETPSAGPSAPAPTQAAGNPLENTQWNLISFGDAGAETSTVEGSAVTLTFDAGGRAGGHSGCNSYGGQYTVAGDRIMFDTLVSTLMACADQNRMRQEQEYLQTLQLAAAYQLAGGRLTLTSQDGSKVLTFAGAPAETPAAPGSLENTRWSLDSFSAAGVETSLVGSSQITLEFGPQGQAGGSGGCNTYRASYETREDGALTFGPVLSTRMACADSAITRQEQRFFDALAAAAAYQQSGGQLIILGADGQPALRLISAQ